MSTNESTPPPEPTPLRRGVAAVVVRDGRLLVIQRSRLVEAPLAWCFPGGAIEPGEDEPAALIRELQEELQVAVRPVHRLWQSVTDWQVELSWWLADLADGGEPAPNSDEVADAVWLPPSQLRRLPGLLSSNHAFLDAHDNGRFRIPGLAE